MSKTSLNSIFLISLLNIWIEQSIQELPVKADVGGSQFSSSSSNLDHFQRLTERLTSIESLQVQTLLKLEGLDYRSVTRLIKIII